MKHYLCLILLFTLALARGQAPVERQAEPFRQFQLEAARQGGELDPLPIYGEPDAVRFAMERALAAADAAGDRIADLEDSEIDFENTIAALDLLYADLNQVVGTLYLLKETYPEAELREAGSEAIQRFQDWHVGFSFRDDIYKTIKAYHDSGRWNELSGEDRKLYEDTWDSFERRGFTLPEDERARLEEVLKETGRLELEFGDNIRAASTPMSFTAEELEGVPESFLEAVANEEGTYTVDANVTFHYLTIADNAVDPETRKRFLIARYNRADEENIPLLQQIVTMRREAAALLGYNSWADYQTEPRMAGSEATVREFIEGIASGLEPKFREENETLRQMKVRDTGESDAELKFWDIRYYRNQLKKQRYSVDTEELRKYFPYQQTLEGMFEIYEQLFSLKIIPVTGVEVWHPKVSSYVITDAESGRPFGLFHLDMYPREGKYNHFACFGPVEGYLQPDGQYRRPVTTLVCNFPPPGEDRPSLLSYDEVETLFHEFGHLLHQQVTRATYQSFAGTNVPRDFVEAPSQMLEYWLEDKTILDRFAANWEDPSDKIPAELIGRMIAAEKSTIANHYRRQIAFAMMDLNLHSEFPVDSPPDVSNVEVDAWKTYVMEPSFESAFVAGFGHLMGYDAGYYGYMWSEVIAADMAEVFRSADGGFLDTETGLRLRDEIYAVGDTRDINESIRAFLGRPASREPFLRQLGLYGGE
ncbi:MAG: M3 family metallopeptidase [Opitutales bacterium]